MRHVIMMLLVFKISIFYCCAQDGAPAILPNLNTDLRLFLQRYKSCIQAIAMRPQDADIFAKKFPSFFKDSSVQVYNNVEPGGGIISQQEYVRVVARHIGLKIASVVDSTLFSLPTYDATEQVYQVLVLLPSHIKSAEMAMQHDNIIALYLSARRDTDDQYKFAIYKCRMSSQQEAEALKAQNSNQNQPPIKPIPPPKEPEIGISLDSIRLGGEVSKEAQKLLIQFCSDLCELANLKPTKVRKREDLEKKVLSYFHSSSLIYNDLKGIAETALTPVKYIRHLVDFFPGGYNVYKAQVAKFYMNIDANRQLRAEMRKKINAVDNNKDSLKVDKLFYVTMAPDIVQKKKKVIIKNLNILSIVPLTNRDTATHKPPVADPTHGKDASLDFGSYSSLALHYLEQFYGKTTNRIIDNSVESDALDDYLNAMFGDDTHRGLVEKPEVKMEVSKIKGGTRKRASDQYTVDYNLIELKKYITEIRDLGYENVTFAITPINHLDTLNGFYTRILNEERSRYQAAQLTSSFLDSISTFKMKVVNKDTIYQRVIWYAQQFRGNLKGREGQTHNAWVLKEVKLILKKSPAPAGSSKRRVIGKTVSSSRYYLYLGDTRVIAVMTLDNFEKRKDGW